MLKENLPPALEVSEFMGLRIVARACRSDPPASMVTLALATACTAGEQVAPGGGGHAVGGGSARQLLYRIKIIFLLMQLLHLPSPRLPSVIQPAS